ncbi:MAG: hypothetical protein JO282_00645 [Alphaproteobacteria bacterium]|nr:hypothetical protein [Alphaproteobacteria bacterium]
MSKLAVRALDVSDTKVASMRRHEARSGRKLAGMHLVGLSRIWIPLAALLLGGCVYFQNLAQRGYSQTGDASTTFTTADVRIITERRHPILGNPVICTEPSPDVAKALSTAFAASGQGGSSGGESGGLALSASSAEAVTELAGRTTALLGLRDGLYRACEAFANGAIGAGAYGLVLTRYGQLMTTLFLGQDIAGVGAAEAKAAVQSPPVSATASTPGGGTSPAGSATASVTAPPAVPSGAPGAPPTPGGGTSPAGSATASVTAPPAAPSAAPGAPPTPAAGAAAALTRMNEDYMNLDYDLAHLLALACVSEDDPTHYNYALYRDPDGRVVRSPPNPWLTDVCGRLKSALTPDQIAKLAAVPVELVKGRVLAPPVDPMATTSPAAQPKAQPKAAPATAKANPATAAQIDALQAGMVLQYYVDHPAPESKLDDTTLTALAKFQKAEGITDEAGMIGKKTSDAIQKLRGTKAP